MINFEKLLKDIAENKCDKKLNLFDKKMNDEQAKALATVLADNSFLLDINLSGNNIGSEGAQAIAEALKTNKTLTRINLSGNNLGFQGGQAIFESLKINKTLTEINLNGNNLGSETGHTIVEALKTNKTLISISLIGNKLGSETGQGIAKILQTNKILTLVALQNNNLTPECEEEIGTLCYRNERIQEIRKPIIQCFQDALLQDNEKDDSKSENEDYNLETFKFMSELTLKTCERLEKNGCPKEITQDIKDELMLARCSWNIDDFSEKVKILQEIIQRCQEPSLKEKALSLLSQRFFDEAMLRVSGKDKKEAREFFLQSYTYGLHSLQEDEATLEILRMTLWHWIGKVGTSLSSHTQQLSYLLKKSPRKFEVLKTEYLKHCAALGLTPKSLTEVPKASSMGLVATDDTSGKKLVFSAGAAGHGLTSGPYDASQETKVTAEDQKHQEEQKETQVPAQAAQSLDEDDDSVQDVSVQAAIEASLTGEHSTITMRPA